MFRVVNGFSFQVRDACGGRCEMSAICILERRIASEKKTASVGFNLKQIDSNLGKPHKDFFRMHDALVDRDQ